MMQMQGMDGDNPSDIPDVRAENHRQEDEAAAERAAAAAATAADHPK